MDISLWNCGETCSKVRKTVSHRKCTEVHIFMRPGCKKQPMLTHLLVYSWHCLCLERRTYKKKVPEDKYMYIYVHKKIKKIKKIKYKTVSWCNHQVKKHENAFFCTMNHASVHSFIHDINHWIIKSWMSRSFLLHLTLRQCDIFKNKDREELS